MYLVHASNHIHISYCGVYMLTKTLALSALLRCLELCFKLLNQISADNVINAGLGSRENLSQSLVTLGQGCQSLERLCVRVCARVSVCARVCVAFITAGH